MTATRPTPYATRFERLRGTFAQSFLDGHDLIVDSAMLDLAGCCAGNLIDGVEMLGLPVEIIDRVDSDADLVEFMDDVAARLLAMLDDETAARVVAEADASCGT